LKASNEDGIAYAVDADDDQCGGGDVLLTVRLSVDDSLELDFSVVKNSEEPKKINAEQRYKNHKMGTPHAVPEKGNGPRGREPLQNAVP